MSAQEPVCYAFLKPFESTGDELWLDRARAFAMHAIEPRFDTPHAQLGPVYGPMVIFAAATGLRPSELFGLEQRDADRCAGVVYVRPRLRERAAQAHEDTAERASGAAADQGNRSARPRGVHLLDLPANRADLVSG